VQKLCPRKCSQAESDPIPCLGQSLVFCDLSFNEISTFPAFPPHSLPALTHLDMRHNKMIEMPSRAFGHQSSLRYFDCSYNR
jgi:Leucine-rich repeat (LRR) protein